MPNLFLKIFALFWLTVVAVTCVVFAEAHYDRINRAALDRTVTPFVAQQAAQIFEHYGRSEFSHRFKQFNKAFPGDWYFFDQEGNELQGKSASPDVLRLAQQAAASDQTQISGSTVQRLVGQRTIGASGQQYVLVGQLNYLALADFVRVASRIELRRFGTVLLLSSLVCFWLAHYITAPVRKLRIAANQLASGNLAARVDGKAVERRDEIAQLSRDFNNMAQQIESLISSQKRLVTDISHELRSPLARMTIALGLARRHADSHTTAALDRIEREAERLNDLIGNLLKLSRLEARANSPAELEPIALDELIYAVAADGDYEARSRNRSVCVLHAEPCSIRGIPELLRSAIENVVRNGVTYTAPSSAVEITLEFLERENTSLICVRDHGHGIPEKDLENIFRPFFRVEDARDRCSGGTGLGLAITDRIVQLHGGRVKAENAGGGGLTVELRFPTSSRYTTLATGLTQTSYVDAEGIRIRAQKLAGT